jgi:signal transduction histidine kinase
VADGAGTTSERARPRRLALWRTTTFRLTAIFVLIFVLFAVSLLGYIAYQSSILIQRQQLVDIERELGQLNREYQLGGTRALVLAIQRFARGPGPGIYFVADPSGVGIAGNVIDVPISVLEEPGQHTFAYERDRPSFGDEDPNSPEARGMALVRSFVLPSGYRVVVGRDIVERRSFAVIIFQAFFWGVIGIVVFSVIAGAISARRVLRRIDAIGATSRMIMTGDLGQRVPVTRRNDEFDGLATSLNAMLDRIEQLMQGMKDVTDNVAHDLKTPLTRMRNKVEAALRDDKDEDAAKRALESTIEECDHLIKTFNALLMIARIEAGTPASAFEQTDLSAVANDVAELYAPVLEDAGLDLKVEVPESLPLRANRELLGQALVNLLENAIKYVPRPEKGQSTVTIAARDAGENVILEVADQGPGIPEADRERVLERFVRLEKSRTEAGSGLGLSLVAAVAQLHKGRVEIDDNHPGAILRLILPRQTGETAA